MVKGRRARGPYERGLFQRAMTHPETPQYQQQYSTILEHELAPLDGLALNRWPRLTLVDRVRRLSGETGSGSPLTEAKWVTVLSLLSGALCSCDAYPGSRMPSTRLLCRARLRAGRACVVRWVRRLLAVVTVSVQGPAAQSVTAPVVTDPSADALPTLPGRPSAAMLAHQRNAASHRLPSTPKGVRHRSDLKITDDLAGPWSE
ncbi:hypothetical protein GCM10009828_058440 [Actinoplanes couchii]|uniref:Uncharacterized protein n=1 Tax=Actinoplanes couchii TaxID=403638 RepID=A0ABQ3XU32_9ACTN|nr:hypothetical protein Aco03nite_104350 [Actinoplanes couchii]